jgi:multicomponent Na+:H+ antiporter subunit C
VNLTLAIVIGVLFGVGTSLVLRRTLTRIVIGVGLIGNGVNLLLVAAGGPAAAPPLLDADGQVAGPVSDPLPQAMALTAIVIAFGMLAFLLALAYRNWVLTGNDEVEDDVEDRRIAALGRMRRDRNPSTRTTTDRPGTPGAVDTAATGEAGPT